MTEAYQNTELLAAMRELARLLRESDDVARYVPIRDRVLVLPLKEDDIHKVGSLYAVGGGRNETHAFARVVAVGPGVRNKAGKVVPPEVEVGQTVVAGSYVGEVLEIKDVEYRLVKAGDILAIIEQDAPE